LEYCLIHSEGGLEDGATSLVSSGPVSRPR
jgi:hypothetical protein